MTNNRPYIVLNRLIVVKYDGKVAFDERFHRGVNIIRGQNSSGKSTISNLIFFVLGGDFNNWTKESLKCRDVIAEVEINGSVVTLKRQISEKPLQSMSIFWNNYEESQKDSNNWQTYSYKQGTSSNTASFTNVIFNILNYPEIKDENDSNITLHQILRLMYIDQETPTQSLFRFERFDQPLTRQAVSELLLGIYDDELYSDRLLKRKLEKVRDNKEKQYEGVVNAYQQSGTEITIDKVQKKIDDSISTITKIEQRIDELRKSNKVKTQISSRLNSERLQDELLPLKLRIRDLKSEINIYEIEISDSDHFVRVLENRVVELDNSLLTRKVLGEIPLTHCPKCLSPLDNHVAEGHCHLCKQPVGDEPDRANAMRMRLELILQIKESKGLILIKNKKLLELKSQLPIVQQRARKLQKELDSFISNIQSTRDENIDKLLLSKGELEKELEYLIKQRTMVVLLEILEKELLALNTQIEEVKLRIKTGTDQMDSNNKIAIQMIQDNALSILKNDLERQEEFRNGSVVDIDFRKDTFSLDGNNNFSASSKVYLKNAILFSIFFSSLNLEFFRYPRFILCDNMEDKGMEKERSQNFQKLITQISSHMGDNHQIIFTTSMIADDLEGSSYCVGEFYERNNKTLKI